MDDNEEMNEDLPQESGSATRQVSNQNNLARKKIQERLSKSIKQKAVKQTLIKALLPILTYVVIFLIILVVIIGIVLFFITMPGMVIEQIKELARSVGNAVASWFGADTTQQVEDVEIYETLDYLEQMGYDLKGYGFLTDYVGDDEDGVERDEDGKISNAESQFISSYLVSDNYVYTIKNFNQKASNPIAAIGQHLASLFTLGQTNQFWSRGMIDIWLDGGVIGSKASYYSVYNLGSINVDVEKKELEIKRGWLNNSMKYNLDGWTGRYGMPIDFLISVHLATMMPDLAYDMTTSFETVIELMLHPVGGGTGDQNTAIGYYKIGDSYKSYDDFKEAAASGFTGSLNSWRISKKEAKSIMDEFGIKSPENCMGTDGVGEDEIDIGSKTQKLDFGTIDIKCVGDSGYDSDDKGKENKKAAVDTYNEVMNTLKGYGLTKEIAEDEGVKLTISSLDEYKDMLEEVPENEDLANIQYFYKEPSRNLSKQITWPSNDEGYQTYTAELTLIYNNYSTNVNSMSAAGGTSSLTYFNNITVTYKLIGTWTQERIDEWVKENDIDVPEEARCSQVDKEYTCSACRSYVQKIYDYLKKADVANLEIYQPYIAKVKDHWYRDVYFVSEPGNEFVDYDYDYEAIMKERWTLYETYGSSTPDKEGEYKLYEINDDGTYKKNGNDYVLFEGTQEEASAQGKKVAKKAKLKKISEMSDDLNWQEIGGLLSAYEIEGVTQEDFQAVYPDVSEDDKDWEIKKNIFVSIKTTGNVTQTGEGQRTETNPKIKKMFLQNRYLKYDGSQETAEIITALRKNIDSDGYYGPVKGQNFNGEDVDYTKITAEVDGKTYKVSDYSGEVSLNQDSLNAFSMLENEHTLDSDYIYRDFKELAVELGYFEKEELTDETPRLLQFLVPEIGSGAYSDSSLNTASEAGQKVADAAKRVYDYCKKHGYQYENSSTGVGLIDITKEDGTTTTGKKLTMCSAYVTSVLVEAGIYDKEGFKTQSGDYFPPYAKDFWRFGKSGNEMGVKTTGTEENHKNIIEYMNQKFTEMELVQDDWDGETNAAHSGEIDKDKLQAGDILVDAHYAIDDVGGHVAIYDGNGSVYENGTQHSELNESKFSRVLRVKDGSGTSAAGGLSGFPNRAIDKNEHEYGTMIHSKGDIDANRANTLKSLITDAIVTAVTNESEDEATPNTVNGISIEESQRLDETIGEIAAQDNTNNLFVKVGAIPSDLGTDSSASSSGSSSTSSSKSLLSLEEWWAETQKIFDVYESEGWVYSDHGAGQSQGCNKGKTFEEARESGHHDTDCSIGASWMLHKLGALSEPNTFTSHLGQGGELNKNMFAQCAEDFLDAGADAFVPKGSVNFTNAANSGELEPGDVLFYEGHVSIYCGDSWEGAGTTFCWDTGSDSGINGGGPRDDSWENRPIKLIVRFPLGNSSGGTGNPYEGYSGNEAVVSPVTGILLEYGTYDGEEKDSVTNEVYRTNIDLKYGTGILKPSTQNENVTNNNQTQTQDAVKTEGRIQVDKVGYAKILVLDKENYKKIEQKLLSETRWSDSFLSKTGKYRDINDLTEKQITDEDNPWSDIDKTLYGYKEFAESYEEFGIAGNVIYIEGFKTEMPDEEFDKEADLATEIPEGEEIKKADFEKITPASFENGKITADSEDILESLYERDKEHKLASKKATEKLKAENTLKENAISSLYVNGLVVLKEGTVIGRTITDRELIVDYRGEKYEDYRNMPDDLEDSSDDQLVSNSDSNQEAEQKEKVIGNYLRIIMRNLDTTVVENVEDYMKLDEVGDEDNTGTGGPQPYKAQEGDDVLLANMMHHEGCTCTFEAWGYSKEDADKINMTTGYVLLNRAIVNYGNHGTTIREQLLAPGQYATSYVSNSTTIECTDCYENAKLCLQYDCNYVTNPKGIEMTHDVLGQSGWDNCSNKTSTPGESCFWWVDDNFDGIPQEYTGPGNHFDEFFCYNSQYKGK